MVCANLRAIAHFYAPRYRRHWPRCLPRNCRHRYASICFPIAIGEQARGGRQGRAAVRARCQIHFPECQQTAGRSTRLCDEIKRHHALASQLAVAGDVEVGWLSSIGHVTGKRPIDRADQHARSPRAPEMERSQAGRARPALCTPPHKPSDHRLGCVRGPLPIEAAMRHPVAARHSAGDRERRHL